MFPTQKFLTACAWGVHLYTALGAALGLLAIFFASRGDFRASFLAMGAATIIDCSDGPLARWLMVKIRVPTFDGALLDNIVDYLTYTVAPVFLMLEAGIIPDFAMGPGAGVLRHARERVRILPHRSQNARTITFSASRTIGTSSRFISTVSAAAPRSTSPCF